MRTGNIMIGAIAKRISSKFEEGDKVKIAKEYGGGTGKVVQVVGGFVVVKTKRGDESYHSSDLKVISGIGAVKKSFYGAKELLNDLKQMDPYIENLSKVKIKKLDSGNLVIYNNGYMAFVLPKNYLSASTIARYAK